MKLTKNQIAKADKVININSISDIPLKNIALKIGTAMIRQHGFYGYENEKGERVLIVMN